MVWRRIAPSMMSPRHWKEIEMAISPRRKSTREGSHFEQPGQVRSSSAAFLLWREREGGKHSSKSVGGAQRRHGRLQQPQDVTVIRNVQGDLMLLVQLQDAFKCCQKCGNFYVTF